MRILITLTMFMFAWLAVAEGPVEVADGSIKVPVVEAEVVAASISAPDEVADIVGIIPILIEAYNNSQWLMLGALISLIVTFIAKKYVLPKLKVGNGLLPVISALVGVLGGVGLAVANGAEPGAASMAVLSGPLASTLWDAGIKYFFRK